MPIRKDKVAFYEVLGVWGLISTWVWRNTTFFNSESFALRQLLKVFRLPFSENAPRAISDGDLEKSPGVRKAAYEQALRKTEEVLQSFEGFSRSNPLGIDAELIIRKFLVEVLFQKYHFCGLAHQYAVEHPNAACTLHVDNLLRDMGLSSMSHTRVVAIQRFPRIRYLADILVMPVYCILFYQRYKGGTGEKFVNSIICQIDGRKSYRMFLALFGQLPNLRFVIERQYLVKEKHFEYFSVDEARQLGFVVKSLSSMDYKKLKELTRLFVPLAIRNFFKLSQYGSLIFDLYGVIARGLLQSVNAKDSAYIAYEHLFASNAVRNELLRASGNLSISLPYGTQIESHFFSCGYMYNYDILCSTGKLQEQVYFMQRARTRTILPVGSYEINKENLPDGEFARRIARLQAFKGADTSITILSSGIQDETYSGEVRLMQLARRLAEESGVKVFIRPKPVPPPAKYRDALAQACGGSDAIMMTGPEYQLTDFLPVTDLFITFASHSAADICAAGGNIFVVNFLGDEAFALWQSTVTGVYLESETAFESIMSWVRDSPPGQRAAHNRRMGELSKLISYKYKTFDAYKNNLLERLSPFLPKCVDACRI